MAEMVNFEISFDEEDKELINELIDILKMNLPINDNEDEEDQEETKSYWDEEIGPCSAMTRAEKYQTLNLLYNLASNGAHVEMFQDEDKYGMVRIDVDNVDFLTLTKMLGFYREQCELMNK